MRLIELHEAGKSCPPEDRHYYEREIALRHHLEHCRELEEWRKNLIAFGAIGMTATTIITPVLARLFGWGARVIILHDRLAVER